MNIKHNEASARLTERASGRSEEIRCHCLVECDGANLFGRGFTLLDFGEGEGARALADAARTLRVPVDIVARDEPEVRRAYDAPLALVRPDGHVAWRGKSVANADALVRRVTGQ